LDFKALFMTIAVDRQYVTADSQKAPVSMFRVGGED